MPGAIPAQHDGGPAASEYPAENGPPEQPRPAAPASADASAHHAREEHAHAPAGHAVPGADAAADAGGAPGAVTGPYVPDGSGEPPEEAPGAVGGEPDDGPRPLGLRVEPTGYSPVDAHLRRLEDADHLAVSGHLEVYEDVHRGLRDTLTALDRPAPGPAPRAAGHPHPGS
ncbi:hypothetical protein GCM10012287_10310 [Streptomyces daqingensis]|uniref:Uncharacterized protein n=2 Tax=Streptomyces daqingensis TaxID=1472640 RepID=A0ABQ2LYF5_9ACTN|nr:hypothetical protein GCM10012287_10310 [Streptomyces daqingensis]